MSENNQQPIIKAAEDTSGARLTRFLSLKHENKDFDDVESLAAMYTIGDSPNNCAVVQAEGSRGASVVLTDAPVSTEDGRCISDRLFSKHFGRTEETPELGSADGWVMISRALASKHSGVTGITSLLDAQVESHEIPKRVFREVPIRAIGESEARSPRLMIKRRSLSTTGLIKLAIEQRKHSNIFDVRNPVRYLAVNPNNLRNTLRSAKASGVGVAFVHQTVYYNKITQRWDLY